MVKNLQAKVFRFRPVSNRARVVVDAPASINKTMCLSPITGMFMEASIKRAGGVNRLERNPVASKYGHQGLLANISHKHLARVQSPLTKFGKK